MIVDGTVTNTETLYYSYDAGGTPVSVKYNNTLYFYVTNLQGDVLAIMNGSGTIVVEYTYDAWGYIRNTTGSMAATLGKANALRYRGYVYDTETTLYYLQSRYYNPGTGRFINADALVSTGQGLLGNNMFAYCNNNPISCIDPFGDRFVGVGFQFEIKCGDVTVGIEIVVYFDDAVCKGADFIIAAYCYSGYEISPGQISSILDIIDIATLSILAKEQNLELDALMGLARMAVNGAGISGGFFVIDGYDSFDGIEDYSGQFETWSFSASHKGIDGSVYHSYSPTCQAVGLKFGVSFKGLKQRKILPFEISYSQTEYSAPIVLAEVVF